MVDRGTTNLEIAAIESTVRIDHHNSKVPAKEVLVVNLCKGSCQLSVIPLEASLLLTSTRTHFSFCTCFKSPMIRCFAAAGDALSGDMVACMASLAW